MCLLLNHFSKCHLHKHFEQFQDSDSATSLSILLPCLTTLLVKNLFQISNLNFHLYNLSLFPLVLWLATLEKYPLATTTFQGLEKRDELPLLQDKHPQHPQLPRHVFQTSQSGVIHTYQ